MNSDLIKEVVKWIASHFGKEIVVVIKDKIQHEWQRIFSARNVLILGGKQSGKSSLIQYLATGRPYEIVDGEKRAPAPTALAAVVDHKFALQQGNWLKLKTDVPGDIDLRDTWSVAISDVQPHGIIYMVDGRKSDEMLGADILEVGRSVLSVYQHGLGHLAALHVFVNFADAWATSPTELQRKLRIAREALDLVLNESVERVGLRASISATQLSPNVDIWPDAKRALHHFGADLLA